MPVTQHTREGSSGSVVIVHRLKAVPRFNATPLDGFGAALAFAMPTETAGDERDYAVIQAVSSDVTAATEDASLRLRVMVAGTLTTVAQFFGAGLSFPDNIALRFGDANDVSVVWDATNLLIRPAADDTGQIRFGDGTTDMDVRITLGAAADYFQFDVGAKSLIMAGDSRIDLSSATIAAANTDGGLIKGGTSGARIIEDTANMKFISLYFDDGATSGSAEGIYVRLYGTGAGLTAQALRAFTTIEDVAGANGRGAHISLSFGTSGSITGLGAAVDATLHLPNAVMAAAGTYAALSADINSDGATTDPSGVNELSFLRLANQGNATGVGRVDDKAYLLVLDGGAIAGGNIVESSTTEANYAYSIRVKLGGTVMYLMAASAVG